MNRHRGKKRAERSAIGRPAAGPRPGERPPFAVGVNFLNKEKTIFGPKIMRYNMSSFSNEQIKKAMDLYFKAMS